MRILVALVFFFFIQGLHTVAVTATQSGHQQVVKLYEEFQAIRDYREAEGVTDTIAAFENQRRRLEELRGRLDAIDPGGWSVPEQVDYLLVRAKMDEMDFTHQVLRPWRKDPGFYLDEVEQIAFTSLPLSPDGVEELRARLDAVPSILKQAETNLAEASEDLATIAIRNLEASDRVGPGQPQRTEPPAGVIGWYADLRARLEKHHSELVLEATEAIRAVESYRDWLKENRNDMTTPAGVGLDNYDWYLKHVRLMPFTSDEVRTIGKREIDRASTFLEIEQNKNRDLPPLELAKDEAEYRQRIKNADRHVRTFIREEGILTIPDNIGELDRHVPWIDRHGEKLRFWEELQFRDPLPDHVHATIPGHQFDGRMQSRDRRPIRTGYRDTGRIEGWAFYLEEMMLQAGLLDERPRTRELYYIAQLGRAVRVATEMRMHANEVGIEEAVRYMIEKTPLMDERVAWFDCEVYLREPTYGITYTIGAVQVQQLFADRAMQLGERFNLKEFNDEILNAGWIPISMIRWEMTGYSDEAREFLGAGAGGHSK